MMFLGLAVIGVFFGVGPFAKGNRLLESSNSSSTCSEVESYDEAPSYHVSFRSHKSCNIGSHQCFVGVDADRDGWCDNCYDNGYKCHMVNHH